MKKHIKNYLVPHKKNNHKPYLLRGVAFTFVVTLCIGILGVFSLYSNVLFTRFDFLASVLPGVLVDLTNIDRNESSLNTLTVNETLTLAAQLKANDMAEKSYFAHTSPEGLSPWYWFKQAGYDFIYAGENLAVNFSDSDKVLEAWMASPSHRDNILNKDFTEIGIATAEGVYKGKPTIFAVQLFGRPAVKSSPEVLGDTVIQPAEETLVVLATTNVADEKPEEPIFVAIKNAESQVALEVDEVEAGDVQGTAGTDVVTLTAQSTLTDRVATQPSKIAAFLYGVIGVVVLSVLILMILIKIKVQHKKNIMYGLALLLFIAVLVYLVLPHIATGILIQ